MYALATSRSSSDSARLCRGRPSAPSAGSEEAAGLVATVPGGEGLRDAPPRASGGSTAERADGGRAPESAAVTGSVGCCCARAAFTRFRALACAAATAAAAAAAGSVGVAAVAELPTLGRGAPSLARAAGSVGTPAEPCASAMAVGGCAPVGSTAANDSCARSTASSAAAVPIASSTSPFASSAVAATKACGRRTATPSSCGCATICTTRTATGCAESGSPPSNPPRRAAAARRLALTLALAERRADPLAEAAGAGGGGRCHHSAGGRSGAASAKCARPPPAGDVCGEQTLERAGVMSARGLARPLGESTAWRRAPGERLDAPPPLLRPRLLSARSPVRAEAAVALAPARRCVPPRAAAPVSGLRKRWPSGLVMNCSSSGACRCSSWTMASGMYPGRAGSAD
ncbi:hypothetical protein T492DRAFT_1086147 [Pavlovales sp. CCMP2436]|nr:hypothetical protein T492DRAFT_1086147 [Pavlovales sp. CCMP2436]